MLNLHNCIARLHFDIKVLLLCLIALQVLCRLATVHQQSKKLLIELQNQRQSVFDIEHDTAVSRVNT